MTQTLLLAALCGSFAPSPQYMTMANAETIYFGGPILTMEGSKPTYAEALAVANGKILLVGKRAEVSKLRSSATKLVNLNGKVLMPSFMDAHSHYFSSLTVANQANLYAPPSGPGKDVPSIIATLKQFAQDKNIQPGQLIQAYGYDDTVMPNGRLLNRDDLDAAFPNNPVLVGHVSMHGGVLNSLALKQFGISAATETPPGGIIVRKPGTQEPYGLIMETAWLPVFAALPKPTPEEEVAWSRAGQMLYAQQGITTAHEGATHAADLDVMWRAAKGGARVIDVIAYPFITDLKPILAKYPRQEWLKYQRGVKIGGVKVTIDGSPQGRTAAFTTPYLTGGPAGEKNWKGELTAPQDIINRAVKAVYDLNVPLNLHANGDAAIDAFLRAHELAAKGDPSRDRKVTIIHAQFTRKDQIPYYKKYKLTPSLYTLHTFYFADAHIKNRGPKQTMYISPMRDTLDAGIRATNHTDFVVAPLDQMFMLQSAVTRTSRDGKVIGADQRITPFEGLKTMTINVAYQYGEQNAKGTLSTGKLADMVILSADPTKVPATKIKDIKILETIKEGKTIYTYKPVAAWAPNTVAGALLVPGVHQCCAHGELHLDDLP